jgi:hypothetical protein
MNRRQLRFCARPDAVSHMGADMMDKQGFDLSQGIWRDSGWQEVEDLRKKLESLKELRELVRSLGRAGGKGPLRRAPEEVSHCTHRIGQSAC